MASAPPAPPTSVIVATSTVTSTNQARVGTKKHVGDPITTTKDGIDIPNTYDNPSFFGAYKLKRIHKGLNEYLIQPTMRKLLSHENDSNDTWAGKTVLELGCGAGPTMVDSWKRGAQFVAGCDISERMLEEAYTTMGILSAQYNESVSKSSTNGINGSNGSVSRSWVLAQAPLEDFDPAMFIKTPFKPNNGTTNGATGTSTSTNGVNGDIKASDSKDSDIGIPQQYDIVTAHLCLHYVSNLSEVFKKIFKWIKPGGAFFFSNMHPLVTSVAGRKPLRILNNMSWDANGAAITEPIGFQYDFYHDLGKRNATFIGHDVLWYHRTFSYFINGLSDAGFVVERIEEPIPLDDDVAESPDLAEYRRRPEHLLVRARRPLSSSS